MNHIVIFRTHRFGDILQTQPMIQGLREKYRNAHISFIVDESYQELVTKSELVDTVVGIPYSRQFAQVSDKSLTSAQVQTMCGHYMDRLIQRDIDLAINRSFSQFSALFLNIALTAGVRSLLNTSSSSPMVATTFGAFSFLI